MTDTSQTSNASIIAASSLSVVSILGVLGSCLVNHRDKIMDKMKCWISWGDTKEDPIPDLEAQQTTQATTTTSSIPNITFPIVINNHSGEQKSACVTLPSPFDDKAIVPKLDRSYSDPTFDSSEPYTHSPDTTPTSDREHKSTTTDSSTIVSRRISMDV